MKRQLSQLQHRTVVTTAVIFAATYSHAALAAGGLQKAQGFLEMLKDNLTTFVPIIAVIAGLLLVIMYWFRVVEKETFMRWIVGLIIAGSVGEIVSMFVS